MDTLIVDAEGKVTIPSEVLHKRGLRPGDAVALVESAEGLLVYHGGIDPQTLTWWHALSELLKKRPQPQFLMRLRRHPPDIFFTSCICVMELRHGSRRREDHAVFWQRITHEVLSRVTSSILTSPRQSLRGTFWPIWPVAAS